MYIRCNDVSYFVDMCGKGEPLLLLHGFTGDHSTWRDVTNQLQKDYLCIAPDLIGHGKSDSPIDYSRYSLENAAEDLKQLLDALNIASCHLLGYSMGGRLALQFTTLFPEMVKTLVLESASPGLREEKDRELRRLQDNQLAERIELDGIEAFADYWRGIPLFQSQMRLPLERRRAIHSQRLQNNPKGLANSLRGMGTGIQQSLWSRLKQLQMPMMLLTGELDEKFCGIAGEMLADLPNGEWQMVDDVGHAIHVEDSEMFGRIVSGFIDKWKERDYGNQLGTRT